MLLASIDTKPTLSPLPLFFSYMSGAFIPLKSARQTRVPSFVAFLPSLYLALPPQIALEIRWSGVTLEASPSGFQLHLSASDFTQFKYNSNLQYIYVYNTLDPKTTHVNLSFIDLF